MAGYGALGPRACRRILTGARLGRWLLSSAVPPSAECNGDAPMVWSAAISWLWLRRVLLDLLRRRSPQLGRLLQSHRLPWRWLSPRLAGLSWPRLLLRWSWLGLRRSRLRLPWPWAARLGSWRASRRPPILRRLCLRRALLGWRLLAWPLALVLRRRLLRRTWPSVLRRLLGWWPLRPRLSARLLRSGRSLAPRWLLALRGSWARIFQDAWRRLGLLLWLLASRCLWLARLGLGWRFLSLRRGKRLSRLEVRVSALDVLSDLRQRPREVVLDRAESPQHLVLLDDLPARLLELVSLERFFALGARTISASQLKDDMSNGAIRTLRSPNWSLTYLVMPSLMQA